MTRLSAAHSVILAGLLAGGLMLGLAPVAGEGGAPPPWDGLQQHAAATRGW